MMYLFIPQAKHKGRFPGLTLKTHVHLDVLHQVFAYDNIQIELGVLISCWYYGPAMAHIHMLARLLSILGVLQAF
jgi:hypothetical protein